MPTSCTVFRLLLPFRSVFQLSSAIGRLTQPSSSTHLQNLSVKNQCQINPASAPMNAKKTLQPTQELRRAASGLLCLLLLRRSVDRSIRKDVVDIFFGITC